LLFPEGGGGPQTLEAAMASVRRVTESRCVAATLGDHRSSQYGGRVPAINADGGPLHLNDCSGAFLRAEMEGPWSARTPPGRRPTAPGGAAIMV